MTGLMSSSNTYFSKFQRPGRAEKVVGKLASQEEIKYGAAEQRQAVRCRGGGVEGARRTDPTIDHEIEDIEQESKQRGAEQNAGRRKQRANTHMGHIIFATSLWRWIRAVENVTVAKGGYPLQGAKWPAEHPPLSGGIAPGRGAPPVRASNGKKFQKPR